MNVTDATDMPNPISRFPHQIRAVFNPCSRFPVVFFARCGQKRSLKIPAEILRDFALGGVVIETTDKNSTSRKKDTVMKTKHNLLSKISLGLGLAVVLAFASGCTTNTSTGDQMKPMKGGEHQMMLPK